MQGRCACWVSCQAQIVEVKLLKKAACMAQDTQRRYDQAIVQGAKDSVHSQHEKAAAGGGDGIDTQGAGEAIGEGVGQAADKVLSL